MRRGGMSSCLSGFAFGLCCVVTSGVTRFFRDGIAFQDALGTPLGVSFLGVLALCLFGSFVLWNRAPERRPLLGAVLVVTPLNLAALLVVVDQGWLAGTAFRPHPVVQALVYGPAFVCFLGVPLAVYHWLSARSRAAAAVTYGVIVAGMAVASIPMLREFLGRGVYVFGGGYTMATNIGWGVAQYTLGLAIHLGLTRRDPADEPTPGGRVGALKGFGLYLGAFLVVSALLVPWFFT